MPPLPGGSGWLFVEVSGDTQGDVSAAAARVVVDGDPVDSMIVTDPAHATALWRIREDGAGLASRTPAGQPAHAGWEDAAVPPARLGDYLRDFDALLEQYGLSGFPYGHFGDGCIHVRLDFPLTKPGGTTSFRAFLLDAADLVSHYGGSMSGEHGDGRARSELLPKMYSPMAIQLFENVKAIFDPANILNPGVLVNPRPLDHDIRIAHARPLTKALALAYHDDGGDFSSAVHRCTGVGKCRADTAKAGGVMCPSYLATRDEKDSTRGRARVLQEMVSGALVSGGWRSPEVRDALDLCLSCKGCAGDRPTGVDMAAYKSEVTYQSYRHRLRPRSHYALGWLPAWARMAAKAPRLANRAMAAPGVGSLGKWAAGVHQQRSLPSFAPSTFRQWHYRHRSSQPTGRPVLLWVDTFTDYFTPEIGISAVRVLEKAGYAVAIPSKPVCCGLTWISTGQLDTARRVLRRSLSILNESADPDTPVLGLEPSCTAVLRHDSVDLISSPEARLLANRAVTLAELLTRTAGWSPPGLSGESVVAQPHCHHAAVLGWDADASLLQRAGATVTRVGGCCGLAGNWGVERDHHDVSVAIARQTLLPAVLDAPAGTRVLADGFSCRTQLADLAQTPAMHLAQLLDRDS